MKKLFAFLMMTACSVAAIAQQMGVQCQVNDSEGEGIPFATIYIYNSDDTATVVSSGVSDAFGKVDHKLTKAGKYVLKAHFVGMEAQNRNFEVSASAPVAQLGTIVLSNAANVLKEVTVTTQRQLDRKSVV